MSKYTIVSGAAVGFAGRQLVELNGESIAMFWDEQRAKDYVAFLEQSESSAVAAKVTTLGALEDADPAVFMNEGAGLRFKQGKNADGMVTLKRVAQPSVPKPALAGALTRANVLWAKNHDWFQASELTEDGYRVRVRHETEDRLSRYFTNYQELRAWAGY